MGKTHRFRKQQRYKRKSRGLRTWFDGMYECADRADCVYGKKAKHRFNRQEREDWDAEEENNV